MALARSAMFLVLLALVALPASAHAGTYDVYSCTLPDGRVAPTEGWTAQVTGKAGFSVSNTCLSPPSGAPTGAMGGQITSRGARGDLVTWIFTAPKFTIIGGFTLYRAAHTAGNGGWFHDFGVSYGLRGPLDQDHWAEFCSPLASCLSKGVGRRQPFHAANRLSISGVALQQIFAQLQCDSLGPDTCEPTSDHGQFEVYSARIELSDTYPPTFSSPPDTSLLTRSAPIEGERALTFSAADRGSGIEKVGVAVDGVIRMQRRANNSRRCSRPFMALVPCPPALSTTFVFDSAQIANGTHTIQASITDAAGNETRSDPVTVTTLNGSQPNGRGASRFVKLSAYLRSKRDKPRRTAVVPYGKTRFAEGRLTDASGRPIAGAILQVRSRVQRPGAKARAIGTVTTSEDGRFAYRIARGPSRTVSFGYKAYSLDPAPVSTAQVSLGVKAGIRLKVRPRSVRNGQKIRFTGRLKGGPARKGTRLTVDVLVPDARRRLPIGTVRADRSGRFRFTYRFRRTLVKARYRFQARLAAQPGYPYRGAASRRVAVVVSP